MEHQSHKQAKATKFFRHQRRELEAADVERSAHYTYRDGFRLGLGIFIGFLVGTLALVLVVFLLNFVLRII